MVYRDMARAFTALPVLFSLLSCVDSGAPTAPQAEPAAEAAFSLVGGRLLDCSSATVEKVSGNIGLGGGAIGVNGHELLIPKGSLASPQRFEIEVRSSPYLVVSFRAEGHDHYQFAGPVYLTVNYSRCESDAESLGDLRVYYVDAATLAIMEDLGGAVDTASNSVTAVTDHLSDYAVGSPQ